MKSTNKNLISEPGPRYIPEHEEPTMPIFSKQKSETTLQIPSEEELIREKTSDPIIKSMIPSSYTTIDLNTEQIKPIPIGWECPRCHKIHSPYSLTCDCPPKFIIKNTDATSIA